MAPWTRRQRVDHEDIDELMDGLSSPSTLQVAASYVLDDQAVVDGEGPEISALDEKYRFEQLEEEEETKTVLRELHMDPLKELLEQLEQIQTSEVDGTDGTHATSKENTKFLVTEKHEDMEDEDEFGDFQSASFDREDNVIAETSLQQQITSPTVVVSDGEQMLASPASFADTCDLERQANEVIGSLQTCRSSESLDTPDLLAQAEAVVRSTLSTPKTFTLDTLSELENKDNPFTPLRTSPREQAQVSPPSAQVRRGVTEASNTTKLSLRLPVEDLSSLESRFTRRRQLHFQRHDRKPAQDLADWGLPAYFFNSPTTDDALFVLQNMPWDLYRDDWNEWDDAITERLCHLDAALEALQVESLQALSPHQQNLDRANENIHKAEQSLRLAMLYWERSQNAVDAAHAGWHGYQLYREEYQERADSKLLYDLVGRVEILIKDYERLVYETEHFTVDSPSCLDDYKVLMAQKNQLLANLNHVDFENVMCLQEIKEGSVALPGLFRDRLLRLLQRLVVRSCRDVQNDCWEEYTRLVSLFVMIDREEDTEDAKQWAETTIHTISFELNRCFAVALLDPEGAEESDFALDLKRMSNDINESWGDAAKVRSIAHNLVIIRFDLEARKRYLPRVGRTLCKLLANCLYRFWLFSQWHRVPNTSGLEEERALDSMPNRVLPDHTMHSSIFRLLENGRDQMWKESIMILGRCFDEYLNFSPEISLFHRKKGSIDDIEWRCDIIDLVECRFLSERLLFLRADVLGPPTECNEPDASEQFLMEKMADLIRRHLRIVHVEAMNTVGRKLSKEKWSLTTFPHQCEPETTGKPIGDIYVLIQTALEAACPFPSNSIQMEIEQRWGRRKTVFSSKFAEVFDKPCIDEKVTRAIRPDANDVANGTDLESFLDNIIRSCDDEPRLASSTLCDEVLPWFGRLSIMMKYLYLVPDDVATVFANIADLYITTIFRACVGSKKAERIILGEDLPSAFVFPKLQDESNESSNTKAPIFSSFRKRPSLLTRKNSSMPVQADLHADLCSPLPEDKEKLDSARLFIFRAQNSLEDIVNLDMVDNWLTNTECGDSVEEKACSAAQTLMKRETAIVSSLVLAYALAVTVDNTVGSAESFQRYSRLLVNISLPLADATRKMSVVHALNCSDIVKDIISVGFGWEESKLHESSNEYIEDLSDLCSLMWGYLNASGKIPRILQDRTWQVIVEMAFVTLADGFSRITNCSTEGRALMTLDTACLSANLSPQRIQERCGNSVVADLPPSPEKIFHRAQLDSYVSAFYLPLTDAMGWVSTNYKAFHLNHSISLIVSVALSSQDAKYSRESNLRQLVEDVKQIYRKGD